MAATFRIDDTTLETMQMLKWQLGASTDEQVLQKALALAKLATENADDSGNVTISSTDGPRRININLRK